MKRYRVDVDPQTKAQIRESFEYIHADSPQNARAWLKRLDKLIASLETMPERGHLIRENEAFPKDSPTYREVYHHSHRLIFCVVGDVVRVVSLRHGARDELTGGEF